MWGRARARTRVDKKRPGTVLPVASSPDIPSQIKMQDTEKLETDHETEKNKKLEVENSDNISFNSINDTDMSFTILSKCEGDNTNVSMINTLNLSSSSFSERKISCILRENAKLKEIFKHKENSTRKQLNAIIVLNKEIRQICENYKQRFFEATDFIQQLKEENYVLKAKHVFNFSTENESEASNNVPTTRELNFIGQLRDLSRQLKASQDNYSKSQIELKAMQNKYTIDVDNFNKVLSKREEELKMLKEKIVSSSQSDLLKSMNQHCKKELETKYLIELTNILKKNLEEKKLVEIENLESKDNKEKLHELFTCFTKYCANSLNVENFPDECNNIIQVFKNCEISYNQDVVDDLQFQNDSSLDYKNALIDDQLQSIKDERIFRNVQVEFLKVYSDYNNVSNKMECLRSEHFIKNDKKDAASDANIHNNFAEIEKCLLEEKKIIDSARVKLNEERLNIEGEKQHIREERELFDAERISLLEEKESIAEENKEIVNENLYLNREVARLKKELASRKESASLKEELNSITEELKETKQKLQHSVDANSELSEQINKMMDKEEEIWAYKIQIESQQNEFHQMRQAEQHFLQQIETLSTEVEELREEIARLRQQHNNQH